MRKHPTPLGECLERARAGAMSPSPVMDLDGKGLRPLTPAERKTQQEKIVLRAEQYARWRVAAYEAGECSAY